MNLIGKLADLNKWDAKVFMRELTKCCASTNWARGLCDARPFDDMKHLLDTSDSIWRGLPLADKLEAFQGHPQIGDVQTLKEKYQVTREWAKGEQAGVTQATDQILNELAHYNQLYLKKFGYIFIVCATGKSADQMLALLKKRMNNLDDHELTIAAEEQNKITRLRLEKMLCQE